MTISHYTNLSAAEVEKLSRLVIDLKLLTAGEFPTDEELGQAPFIDQWSLIMRPVPCLFGFVHGHPRLGTGPAVTTQVMFLDPERQWVRTQSQFYVLGDRSRDSETPDC